MVDFKYKIAEERTNKVIKDILRVFQGLDDQSLASKITEFEEKLAELQEAAKIEIAFIGQYSAGKSSIISSLTGNKDIKIGQDITTVVPKPYPWGSHFLIDTPGIYAGRPEHDALSIEYMNKADLLIYVITSQGFSEETAKNFQKIAFDENRIDKIMLVINKSSQGNKTSSLNNWISDALKVTEPKTEADLYLSVIDAKDYIEALEMDDAEDKLALIEYSGYDYFFDKLNSFISDKGILGRLITPLNIIETYSNDVLNNLSSSDQDTKNLLELLNRKRFRLVESKKKITDVINGHIDELVSVIKAEGNKIANLIEVDGQKEILDSESKNSIGRLSYLSEDANKKVGESIEDEFSALQEELDFLMKSELAQALINQDVIQVSFNTDVEIKGFDKSKVESGVDILNNVGRFAKGFASNKDAAKLGVEGLKKAAGSDAHKAIYNVGKFFGHNFKPYEAVKYADKVAKVGNVVSKVAVVLPFLIAGYEEYAERKYGEKIKQERQKIRGSYDEIAENIKSSFRDQFNLLVKDTYDIELRNTDKISSAIRDSEKLKTKEIAQILELRAESQSILDDLVR